MSRLQIEYEPREVIGDQLLSALDDKSKVAILCNVDDLDMLIMAMNQLGRLHDPRGEQNRTEFIAALRKLRKAAFSKETRT